MPSRRKLLHGTAIQRRLKSGFGAGNGKEYMPYLRVSDVPSRGTCTVITGWKHGREHHLLSRGERNYFYCLEWQDDVLEIREQYPLLPLTRTLQIAALLGFRHPSVAGKPVVMTTDFFLDVADGTKVRNVARTFKRHNDLANRRVLEKLDIERHYFAELGIDWGIVTDEDIPDAVWRNVDWLHECRDVEKLAPITVTTITSVRAWMAQRLERCPFVYIGEFCTTADVAFGLHSGTALKILRHLFASKIFQIDITTRLRTDVAIGIYVKGVGDE